MTFTFGICARYPLSRTLSRTSSNWTRCETKLVPSFRGLATEATKVLPCIILVIFSYWQVAC